MEETCCRDHIAAVASSSRPRHGRAHGKVPGSRLQCLENLGALGVGMGWMFAFCGTWCQLGLDSVSSLVLLAILVTSCIAASAFGLDLHVGCSASAGGVMLGCDEVGHSVSGGICNKV